MMDPYSFKAATNILIDLELAIQRFEKKIIKIIPKTLVTNNEDQEQLDDWQLHDVCVANNDKLITLAVLKLETECNHTFSKNSAKMLKESKFSKLDEVIHGVLELFYQSRSENVQNNTCMLK